MGNTMQYQYFAGYQTNLSACKLMQLFLLVSSYVQLFCPQVYCPHTFQTSHSQQLVNSTLFHV